jgi:multicomponent Na+:H+ antiporter subunit D
MTNIVVYPLLIPLGTAALLLFAWSRRSLQRAVSVLGAALLLGASFLLLAAVSRDGIQVMQMGGWPAPFGITLVADLFSAVMVVMAGLIGFAVAVYSVASTDREHVSSGFHPLYHILLLGVCGSFLTGDIFNLYVWFEVMLISSFVLIALGGHGVQMEGALKYVTLNLIASALFLAAVGILYGVCGTLNMADLSVALGTGSGRKMHTVLAMLFFMAFGIKSAVFPLFFWLPASYHTPPAAVSAVFAGLLTKVGVYSLIRVFTLLFVHDTAFTHTLILIVSGFTMVTGVLGAVAQDEFRKVLSFHIISQVGYMIMGLGLFTPLALAGSIFYIVHHIIVKTNLFLVSGAVHAARGTYELKRLGGLFRSAPALALLFLVPALSLAGMPPLSGFWAKLVLIASGLRMQNYAIAAVALVVGMLTLFSMTKIWTEAFWKGLPAAEPAPQEHPPNPRPSRLALYLPMSLLAATTIVIGLAAGPLLDLSMRAAEQLLDPSAYRQAVLGGIP